VTVGSVSLDDQGGDEEPAQHEEEVDAEEPALGHHVDAQEGAGVHPQHQRDGERAQAVQRGSVPECAHRALSARIGQKHGLHRIARFGSGPLQAGYGEAT
jgi:hypothetical protein